MPGAPHSQIRTGGGVNACGAASQIRPPRGACPASPQDGFSAVADLFADARMASELAEHYEAQILGAMERHEAATGAALAACLIEPVMQGAGGMLFVDPLFQKVLVRVRFAATPHPTRPLCLPPNQPSCSTSEPRLGS